MLTARWDRLGARKGVANLIGVREPSAPRLRLGVREPRPTTSVAIAFISFMAFRWPTSRSWVRDGLGPFSVP
jgi:hypothetical protein